MGGRKEKNAFEFSQDPSNVHSHFELLQVFFTKEGSSDSHFSFLSLSLRKGMDFHGEWFLLRCFSF